MSGPFGSSQWMYQSAAGFYPYQIEQSLRFNDDDSAYLSRTPASAGNRKTWTWSGWVKRGNLGTQVLFSKRTAAASRTIFRFASDTLDIIDGDTNFRLQTTQVFRDPSSWYHIILAVDTTQATSSDRVKLYVNGDQVTAFSTATYPSLNFDTQINTTNPHYLGSETSPVNDLFDGYMAEVNFIDGTALDPTSFGEFKSGIWVPKAYAGAYGTNGFYLSFADSAAIGDDLSGNGNDWTANNLVATDVLLDSPTNNFCTYNPLNNLFSGNTLSNGNLQANTPINSPYAPALASFAMQSGKWYWESLDASGSGASAAQFGVVSRVTANDYGSNQPVSVIFNGSNGGVYKNTSTVTTVGAFNQGDIIGVALDMDALTLSFYKNNVLQATVTGLTVAEYFACAGDATSLGGGYSLLCNFGQDSSFAGNKTAQGNTDANGVGDFYYAPPSGFLALCTRNLPDPVIDPAQDDVPSDYFNTITYDNTGGSYPEVVTGVGFQPDLIWIKSRSQAYPHYLFDAVRGTGVTHLSSNSTAAEGWDGVTDLDSFDSDGFTIGAGDGIGDTSAAAWNWLAGNGTASNTDGSITSTVSVNQKAGFSVVTYGGTGTVGHGLSQAPELIIAKARASVSSWSVNGSIGPMIYGTNKLLLESTAGLAGDTNEITAVSSTTFTTGGSGATSSASQVAYCFHSVEGYSKFGSYTGNGSTDGPFVWCGFRPAFVMIKKTSATGNWIIFDAARGAYNLDDEYLYANSSDSEGTSSTSGLDLLSNGFKNRNAYTDANASGATYIFMAFAESPFKYANAR